GVVHFENHGGGQADESGIGAVADARGQRDPLRRVRRQGVEDRAHRPLAGVGQHRQGRLGLLVGEVLDLVGGVGRPLDEDGGRLDRVENRFEQVRRRRRQVADAVNAAERLAAGGRGPQGGGGKGGPAGGHPNSSARRVPGGLVNRT